MNEFDENLLYGSKIIDTLFKSFGECAPKKRIMCIDYKENGIDKNISVAAYQIMGMSDKVMIMELVKVYSEQNKIVSCITEVNEKSQFIGVLYITPECFTE